MFVDRIKVLGQAGNGGRGCVSFRREKYVPKGGPDGGDGGRGGDVILRADIHVDNLSNLFYEPIIKAKNGGHGTGKKMHGRGAVPKVVKVPIGTMVYRDETDGSREPKPVADLTHDGEEFVLCEGGKGGKGNVHFKSSKNRAPIQYTEGEEGEQGRFLLELHTMADAALVGYPNAGKSTLLGKISAAHPKVASYPFTTLHPIVGVIEFDGYRRASVADIPGLIEGAHRDVGLGHDFLRHITRCRLLLFVLDIAGSEGRHPIEDLQSLRREIDLYDPRLSQRPWHITANKMDLPGAEENLHALQKRFPNIETVAISAAKSEGLTELKDHLQRWLFDENAPPKKKRKAKPQKSRPANNRWTTYAPSRTIRLFMAKRVVASYCTTFLKPEMLHIYRQVRSLHEFDTFVMTKALQNIERFPFRDIELIPKPRNNPLRHGWLKWVKQKPAIVYRGEYQMLSKLLERRGADLMHIYFGHTGVHLLPFIERWHKPCVVSFHGADVAEKKDIRDYGPKLKNLFDAVPLVLARSKSLAERLLTLGCPPERLRINRTGVPLHEFPFIRRDAPTDGRWRFMQACRLIPKKGVATSLCAFAIFQKEFPNAELVIAGKGPLQAHLEELAEELGIASKVHFRGFLSQEELFDLYASSHGFLHPSETPPDQNQEGIPNSILEAMATGLAILATRHGGIPEAVEEGRSGTLVEERDFEALAAAMKNLVRSPFAFREMGALASESVAANFEQREQIRQLEAHYDEAIALAGADERVAAPARDLVEQRFAEQIPVKVK